MNKIVLGGKYNTVNVRREPREGNTVIGSLPRGVVFETVGETGEWYQVIAYVRKDATESYSPAHSVPYVSQIAGSNPGALTSNDCQQACLSMIFEYKTGMAITPDQITKDLREHPSWYNQNGSWIPGKYTTLNQGVEWLKWRGIAGERSFAARGSLPFPNSVVLINYSNIKPVNAYDKAFYVSRDPFHFVVFLEGDDQTVFVNDPLWPSQAQGRRRKWTREEWNNAFTGSTIQIT